MKCKKFFLKIKPQEEKVIPNSPPMINIFTPLPIATNTSPMEFLELLRFNKDPDTWEWVHQQMG